MRRVAICLTLFSNCWGHENPTGQVADISAIEWLRKQLKEELPYNSLDSTPSTQFPCKSCFLGGASHMEEPHIYVFMSFSIPEETWLTLSKEMETFAAVFVLNGVPQNSFQELAHRVLALKKKGMQVEIRIDPSLFEHFHISTVPTFVMRTDLHDSNNILYITVVPEAYDIIKGNISLEYVLKCTQDKSND